MRGPRLACGCLAVALALSGCGAAGPASTSGASGASASSTPAAPTPAPPPVTVPADGVLLRDFGYRFGPLEEFSLPRTSVVTTGVDQADNVTLVLSAPSPAEVTAYLRRALPGAGFRVTADDRAASTLTFTGHGWSGSVTGTDGSTGVLLRPV